jgi:hypothetical protein
MELWSQAGRRIIGLFFFHTLLQKRIFPEKLFEKHASDLRPVREAPFSASADCFPPAKTQNTRYAEKNKR